MSKKEIITFFIVVMIIMTILILVKPVEKGNLYLRFKKVMVIRYANGYVQTALERKAELKQAII